MPQRLVLRKRLHRDNGGVYGRDRRLLPCTCSNLILLWQVSHPFARGSCAFTEMKDPHVRSRLLALAEDNDILVPTRGGAYVPARIAFRENKGNVNGGL